MFHGVGTTWAQGHRCEGGAVFEDWGQEGVVGIGAVRIITDAFIQVPVH